MTPDIPIQITNMTSPVVVRAEDPVLTIATLALAFATFILVIVTFFGNKWTNENTKKSNAILELELKSRIRPAVQLEFGTLHPSQVRKGEEIWKNIRGEIANLGTVPLSNIRFYFNYNNKKPSSLAEIIKEKDYWRKREMIGEFGTILSNTRNSSYKTFASGEFQYQETEQNPLWVVAWIEYKYLDKFEEKCIFVFRVNGETVDEQTMVFYSNSDITEEEKRKPSKGANT